MSQFLKENIAFIKFYSILETTKQRTRKNLILESNTERSVTSLRLLLLEEIKYDIKCAASVESIASAAGQANLATLASIANAFI